MTLIVPNVTFHNGSKCPVLGIGTWQSEPGKVAEAVKYAIDAGYRHIDCALAYGNEKEVGEAIRQKITEGVVKREDLFITSKLWNTFHRADLVKVCCKQSLSDLGLDYLDLYLIHWPMAYKEDNGLFPKDSNDKILYSDVPCTETWKGMEKLIDEDLVKSIGLANFNSKQIENVLAIARIKPVVNQIECHPYLNQKKLKNFCERRGILITAYSPLGSPNRPWVTKDDPVLLEDPKIVKIAGKYKKSSAQILIKYQIQRGNIVIPKSVTKSRIIENANVFDFTLDQSDMDAIDSFDVNGRLLHLNWVSDHKDYPFNIEF